jgi:3'(2'), 5'-bisphosphate nucleotidase
MDSLNKLLKIAVEAALEAGRSTLVYYGNDIDVDLKTDSSPLTQADLDSNKIIEEKLLPTEIPILSEELVPEAYEERKKWKFLWIVDPLDGTKEFIKKSNEYTINIALVEKSTPIMGVVYAPALDLLFYGDHINGAYKVSDASEKKVENLFDDKIRSKLIAESNTKETVVVASKSHRNNETDVFISKLSEEFEDVKIKSYGSSLKLCMIADGEAQIYPRLGPTMEWDTAASHAIVTASGAKIYQYPSFDNVLYNKENLLNPYFIVCSVEKEKAVKKL